MVKPVCAGSRTYPTGLSVAGAVRPARPASVFAEDFSLLIRRSKRLIEMRGRWYVLH